MSSNIKVQKICQQCGIEFTARTTVTKFCGGTCAKRAYKARLKKQKIDTCNQETLRIKNKPLEDVQSKEFLSVSEAARLLGCSKRTVYRMIDSCKIPAVNLLERMTRIRKSELDKIWEELARPTLHLPPENLNISDCYTINEVMEKYGVSNYALQSIIKRNYIPKKKQGKFVYVPKRLIDEVFTKKK